MMHNANNKKKRLETFKNKRKQYIKVYNVKARITLNTLQNYISWYKAY